MYIQTVGSEWFQREWFFGKVIAEGSIDNMPEKHKGETRYVLSKLPPVMKRTDSWSAEFGNKAIENFYATCEYAYMEWDNDDGTVTRYDDITKTMTTINEPSLEDKKKRCMQVAILRAQELVQREQARIERLLDDAARFEIGNKGLASMYLCDAIEIEQHLADTSSSNVKYFYNRFMECGID